jgi:hypothetical protein
MPVVLGTVVPGNLRRNFLLNFLAEPHFTYDSYRKIRSSTEYRTIFTRTIISTWHDVRHSCAVVWIILAATAVSAWRWFMQLLPEGGKWQLCLTLSADALYFVAYLLGQERSFSVPSSALALKGIFASPRHPFARIVFLLLSPRLSSDWPVFLSLARSIHSF